MKQGLLFAMGLFIGLSVPALAASIKVERRAQLGNVCEDLHWVSAGAHAGNIAVVDNLNVLGVPLAPLGPASAGSRAVSKLFDIRALGGLRATGMAYVESENLYAFEVAQVVSEFYLLDGAGTLVATRPIAYVGGYTPENLDGLAYIPPGASTFPNHLIVVANDLGPVYAPRLEIVRLDGQVVAEVIPAAPVGDAYLVGVTYKAPDRILVYTLPDTGGNSIWTLDFAGNVVAPPIPSPGDLVDYEGLAELPDGSVVGCDVFAGKLFFYDGLLNRTPERDVDYSLGPGVSAPSGVAWDSEANKHLVLGFERHQFFGVDRRIYSLPTKLDQAESVVSLSELGFIRVNRLTFLPAEGLIAVAYRQGTGSILLFDRTGALVETVNLAGIGRPGALAFDPEADEFIIRIDTGNPRLLRFVSRGGALLRTMDLSGAGIGAVNALAWFERPHAAGPALLVHDPTDQEMAVVDLAGNRLDGFDHLAELGLFTISDVTAITSGPDKGSFAVTDPNGSELVVFSMK